jgi:hypothetical protein
MSTQPLGIRVVCDSKRSASCREYIDTGAIQTANARIIARHEGWNTLPGSPKRDICPPCIEHALRGQA